MAQLTRYTVHFSGRVQGVGFRYTAQRIGAHYKLTGYVQNLPDGRVRLVIEGATRELDCLIQQVRQEIGNNISGLELEKTPATGEFGQPEHGTLSIRP